MRELLNDDEVRRYHMAARLAIHADPPSLHPVLSARYYVDTTKATMAAFPQAHVIRDRQREDAVVALCPINPGPEKVCEGQFSFAPVVLRALGVLNDEERL